MNIYTYVYIYIYIVDYKSTYLKTQGFEILNPNNSNWYYVYAMCTYVKRIPIFYYAHTILMSIEILKNEGRTKHRIWDQNFQFKNIIRFRKGKLQNSKNRR